MQNTGTTDAALANQQGEKFNKDLDLFLTWRKCANASQALSILVNLYFSDLVAHNTQRSTEENDELALVFNLLGRLAVVEEKAA